jgi:transcriptional regulator with XRE-family HTH domain
MGTLIKDDSENGLLIRFGQRVRFLRKQKGWSQEQLADETGLHRTYIGSVERGEQNISLKNIAKIANALNVTIVDLFSE